MESNIDLTKLGMKIDVPAELTVLKNRNWYLKIALVAGFVIAVIYFARLRNKKKLRAIDS
jgi:uncharacterized protein involved in exopolysaccharide biosynthesis